VESVKSRKGGMVISRYEYDEQGRISKVSQPMYADGTPIYENGTVTGLFSYTDYVYDANGRLDKMLYYHLNLYAGFQNLETHTFFYDNDGNKRKDVAEYPQALPFQTDSVLYYYDKNRLKHEEHYTEGYHGNENWNSKLVDYIEYEYDSQGNLVKETNYSGTDNTPFHFSVHSNQNGLNVKTEIFNHDTGLKVREIRRYFDRNDNLIYLESDELAPYSSATSYVVKYDYYVHDEKDVKSGL
jgi:hypothetical protein